MVGVRLAAPRGGFGVVNIRPATRCMLGPCRFDPGLHHLRSLEWQGQATVIPNQNLYAPKCH